jgi:hypothetical protein
LPLSGKCAADHFDHLETTDSMRPLHTYPAFTEPRSPVTTYRTNPIRTGHPVAARLATHALRVDVPTDDGPTARTFLDGLHAAVDGALDELGQ